jgi:hypothetical protein
MICVLLLGVGAVEQVVAAAGDADATVAPSFRQDFQQTPPGAVPPEFLVLAGLFEIKADGDNRFLELPGAPLDSFGVMFGPASGSPPNIVVAARIFGTKSGRKFPTFAVGTCGAGGVRLQVSPAKKAIELYHGDLPLVSVPYEWSSGTWTLLRLALVPDGENVRIQGYVSGLDGKLPSEPTISHRIPIAAIKPGRSVVMGSPFSGLPIRFDDLAVTVPAVPAAR